MESFSCFLCSRDFIRGSLQVGETGWWAAQRKLVLGSAPTLTAQVPVGAVFFSGKCPPRHAQWQYAPNKCICPSAKIPAASHWGRCRAGPGWGTIGWKEIRVSVRGGWGEVWPLLTHILASPWAADLGSPQPPLSVSALSSELLSPGEGVLSGVCLGSSQGWGKRVVLLPSWEQLILGSALEPPAGAVGACLGRWDASGSPRHDCIPPNMPAGVHGAEGLAGGRGVAGGGAFGGCLGDTGQLRS